MKKSLIRFCIVNILVVVGILGLLAIPTEEYGFLAWFLIMILSKGIGIFAIVLSIVLAEDWFNMTLINDDKKS